jgi:hypothetical protein
LVLVLILIRIEGEKMDYKGEWEAQNISDDINSILVQLFYKEGELTGFISFTAGRSAEGTSIMVTLLDDTFNFVTQPATRSGYTVNFNGKPVDDNTIEGTLNIGIFTDRIQKEVTFTRKANQPV